MVNILLGIFTILASLVMKGVTLRTFLGMQDYSLAQMNFNGLTAGVLFILSDLHYYWFHRLAHGCRFVWASHIIHHSSQKFNLTVAIRLPFTNGIYRFLFWTPLCLIGFPPVMVMLMDTLVVYYTFFIHTETIGKLGWLEKFLNTPSHHRVHHSNNPEYIDKNFGGVFIFWDKLFGTFAEETNRPRYGITKPFPTHNPVTIICDEWVCMYRDLQKACSITEMIIIIFGHPARQQKAGNKGPAEGEKQLLSPKNEWILVAKSNPPSV
jgi:sterol desaturase/sphingolipid hydroxylase (fatty acid hydroxylase superfamily)